MKNILLPTDFSENSWNAIKYAIRFFETSACNFYLLHVDRLSYMVAGDIPYTATENVIEEVYTKPAKMKLRKILKQISETFPEHKNHKFYTHTDYNFFIESIENFVEEKEIDCIVMGTKGATGLSQYLIGTNTYDVINAASTKWNFMKLTPGLVGGHCISIDPYYLLHKSKMSGYIPDLMMTARTVNDEMGAWALENFVKFTKNNLHSILIYNFNSG